MRLFDTRTFTRLICVTHTFVYRRASPFCQAYRNSSRREQVNRTSKVRSWNRGNTVAVFVSARELCSRRSRSNDGSNEHRIHTTNIYTYNIDRELGVTGRRSGVSPLVRECVYASYTILIFPSILSHKSLEFRWYKSTHASANCVQCDRLLAAIEWVRSWRMWHVWCAGVHCHETVFTSKHLFVAVELLYLHVSQCVVFYVQTLAFVFW